MNYPHKKSRAGFTLIELLVVIAVVGLLSGIVFQSLQSARLKSQNATRLSDVDQIDKALQLYLTKTNASLPSTGGNWRCVGLTAGTCLDGATLRDPAATLNSALAGNISVIPTDPAIKTGYGTHYLYATVTASAFMYDGQQGAYIRWLAYNIGSNPCGRGRAFGLVGGTSYLQCSLFLGKD